MGFTGVAPYDPDPVDMMRLCDDALIPAYREITDTVHKHGCKIMPQLAMGRHFKLDASGKMRGYEIDDLSKADIQDIISLFAPAAVRAGKVGFDGVQIHAAHHFFS
ncbi:MAG: NADH-dependent flavin oxidoreductase [Firmicutes bacterium]|nr:NADH-dependent flavin oxidoreductase [Bacillota bacterium]